MAEKKKSIIEEALLEAKSLEDALKANTKEMLAAHMSKEFESIVESSLKDEEEVSEQEIDDIEIKGSDDEEEVDLDVDSDDSDEEEEEVKVQFTSKAKSARGRKSTKRNAFYGGQESGGGGDSSHGTANARYKPQQTERDAQRNARAQQQRGYGSAHGAGPTTGSQSAQHFTADNVQPKPPTPPPSRGTGLALSPCSSWLCAR